VPDDTRFHIRDAVYIGHANRIGHGVDIAHENNPEDIMRYMKQHGIAVEINLSSNAALLNIKGKQHPLNYYLAHQVPVVLSTDDEGILRTDLTSQYVEAVFVHGLDYLTIKQINRNALTYSFLAGKSLWIDPSRANAVSECADLNSNACLQFVKKNEKARLQRQLEIELSRFEERY
jgi:adenosine deaminase